jgi:hypothetical protein
MFAYNTESIYREIFPYIFKKFEENIYLDFYYVGTEESELDQIKQAFSSFFNNIGKSFVRENSSVKCIDFGKSDNLVGKSEYLGVTLNYGPKEEFLNWYRYEPFRIYYHANEYYASDWFE